MARAIDPAGDRKERAAAEAGAVAPARAEAFRRAVRHSRRVRRLKFLVPASAIALAVGFVAYSYVSTPAAVSVSTEAAAFAEGKLVMANPKLEGVTKDGRPYLMTALRAVQGFNRQGIIDLEGIDAKMPVENDNWARIIARTGAYDRDANTLQLATDITMTTTDGMVARLNSAFFDIGKGMLKSGDPVDIERNGSRITADSMEMFDHGKILVFEKRVRMNIEPAAARTGMQASGGPNASN